MATFAIGDVHGNLRALDDLLGQLRRESGAGDTVVFLGDYIDRGPDSLGSVASILQFQREVSAEVVCLCGNHEDWLLRTRADYGRHSWLLGMDAFETIRSYSFRAELVLRAAIVGAGADLWRGQVRLPYDVFFDSVPSEHLRFFEELREHHQTADCVCTHAGIDPKRSRLDEQPRQALLWGVDGFPEPYSGTEVVVYGHRNNAVLTTEGWPQPLAVNATIGIDTISHGVLTAIRLPDRQVFQSARHRHVPP